MTPIKDKLDRFKDKLNQFIGGGQVQVSTKRANPADGKKEVWWGNIISLDIDDTILTAKFDWAADVEEVDGQQVWVFIERKEWQVDMGDDVENFDIISDLSSTIMLKGRRQTIFFHPKGDDFLLAKDRVVAKSTVGS